MDRDYCLNKNAEDRTESPFKNSMFILSTVISTASAGRGWVTLDAGALHSPLLIFTTPVSALNRLRFAFLRFCCSGLKAYAVDSGLPVVWQNDELDCEQAGDEHTKLIPRTPGNLAALAHFKVGDRVWLVPGHCDPTSNLYDWMVAVQEDKVTDVWAVSARGPGM
jgi:D-serine deaminase-like pyridoxal phosphate-dependent protein